MADDSARGGGEAGGVEEAAGAPSGASSPKNRVKFLCSNGGKIMLRPPDGQLKYIGGETRVIAVPRDITFSDLMKKLSAEFEEDMVLKYQVMPEELDVLVSVRTNEDLKHMFDEYDRQETGGTPKLRAFLFPSSPTQADNYPSHFDHFAMEQRYIDAVNGTLRPNAISRPPPIIAKGAIFSVSACSSPKSTSPESVNADSVHHETAFLNAYSRRPMHKVQSTPNLCGLNTSPHQSSNQLSSYHLPPHHHPHYQQQQQQHIPVGYQQPMPPHDHHRLAPLLSMGRYDMGRSPSGYGINQWYLSRHKMGSGNSNKYAYYDEYPGFVCRASDRLDGHPHSPRNKILDQNMERF